MNWEPVPMEMLFCVTTFFASFWPIIHMDPVNWVPENALFWNRGSGGKILKRSPRVFVWTANLHTSLNDDAIATLLYL